MGPFSVAAAMAAREEEAGERKEMLEMIKAIIYGIVEGITEWLPLSRISGTFQPL